MIGIIITDLKKLALVMHHRHFKTELREIGSSELGTLEIEENGIWGSGIVVIVKLKLWKLWKMQFWGNLELWKGYCENGEL